jgi:tetratricopeptide (TPR) repeat protein
MAPHVTPAEDRAPLSCASDNASQHVAWGHQLSQRGLFEEAEVCYRKAIELDPNHPMAHNNLGWTRQVHGDSDAAGANYRRALQLDPGLGIARRNLATLLVCLGRREESIDLFRDELLAGSEGLAWMDGLVSDAMRARDLTFAGEYAAILAALRWASPWYPLRRHGVRSSLPVRAPVVYLTVPKLRHDIEQFQYLQGLGVLGAEFTPIIKAYERVIERLIAEGENRRVLLSDEDRDTIGHVYNRIVHLRHTPRVEQALSGKWEAAAVEDEYLNKPPGVVVIDDFLSAEALEELRQFCLESTVWSANRYGHGRLGSFFRDGFNCPLLLQIAEELRWKLSRVIGERYPLRQMWGFKNGQHLPADATIHADFAAVNVNFWITPTDANLDPSSGGLVVYGVDAPSYWDFETYNGRPDVIRPFLQHQEARPMPIPYRQNRAIIFNSDLFHGTAALTFRPGYDNRRVNITMLYGDRENDVHHQQLGRVDASPGSDAAWRSAAFTRTRRMAR